jgi:hypothetical protein
MVPAAGLISEIVDAEQRDEGFLIARGVCDELDELKHLNHGLPDFLTRVVEAELQRIPRSLMYGLSLQQWTLIYMPQVKLCLLTEF